MTATCRNKMTGALGAFCLLFSLLPLRADQETNRDDLIPLITANEVPLTDLIIHLAKRADITNYIADPHVPSGKDIPSVTCAFTNITAKEALDRVLKLYGLERIDNPATTVSRIAPIKLGIKPVSPEQIGNDTNAPCPKIYCEDVPITTAIQALADQLHIKVTFDKKFMATPASKLNVFFRWKNLTHKQALVALLDNLDLVMVPDQSGSSARITTKEERPKSKSP